jgi:hypothetical protein
MAGWVLAARPAFSSYIETDLRMPGTFPVDRHYVPLSEAQGEWVLYDLVNLPGEANEGRPLICPANPRFIPLVRIPLTRPLKVMIVRETSLEARLANLLYANLELKKILLDYGKIQAKARELEALARRELAETGSYADLMKRRSHGAAQKEGRPSETGPVPDAGALEERKRHAAAAAVGDGKDRAGEVERLARIARPLVALAEEEKSRGDPLASDRATFAALDTRILLEQEQEKLKKGEAAIRPGTISPSRAQQLPWIFRWVFHVLRFIVSHKFEIALGVIATLAVGMLAALFRPR